MLSLIILICFVIMGINISTIISSNRELKEIDKRYNELTDEIRRLREDAYTKKPQYEKLKSTYVKPTIDISPKPDIPKTKNEILPVNKHENCIQIKTENVKDHVKEDDNFIDILKLRCDIDKGKYVISKRTVASMMCDYNNTHEKTFSREYMVIYGKLFLTQAGINYIDKNVKSVFNDVVDNVLIIDFYDKNELPETDSPTVDTGNTNNDHECTIVDITKLIA